MIFACTWRRKRATVPKVGGTLAAFALQASPRHAETNHFRSRSSRLVGRVYTSVQNASRRSASR